MYVAAKVGAMLATTNGAGMIRLGAPEDYVGALLPHALDRFSRAHPNVEVDVICEPSGSLSRLVTERRIDLALVTRNPAQKSAETLRSEPTVWVASPLHDIHRQPVVPLALFQQGCLGRSLALDALSRAGRAHRVAYSSPSVAGIHKPTLALPS